MKGIHAERIYPHPIETVWEAIATSEGLSAWLMPNDFVPQKGRKFRFSWKKCVGWRGYVDCEVLEVEPPRRLVFSWVGDEKQKPTTVTFELQTAPEGTRLVFSHTGFEGFGGFFGKMMMANGWRKKMLGRQLPAALQSLRQGGRSALVPLIP